MHGGMPRVFFFKRTGDGVQRYLCVQLYDSRCTGIARVEKCVYECVEGSCVL